MLTTSNFSVTALGWQDEAIKTWRSWAEASILTPFAFPTYQQIFSRFQDASYQLVILGVWREAQLIAVFSGHQKAETFWLAGMPPILERATITDYGDMVIAPAVVNEPAICQQVWLAVSQYLQGQGVKKLQLDNLRPDGYLAQALQLSEATSTESVQVQLGQVWSVEVTPQEVAPYLLVAADWETYLAQLRKKDRSELRRKLKRLETVNPSYSFKANPTPADVVDFVKLHRLSDPAKAQFMTDGMVAVFGALAAATYEAGWRWEFGFLTLNGQRVAAVAYFIRSGDRILLYNSGYDPALSQFSVGLAIKAELVKVAIAKHCQEYDFLRGPERYKYDLGAQTRQLYQVKAVLK